MWAYNMALTEFRCLFGSRHGQSASALGPALGLRSRLGPGLARASVCGGCGLFLRLVRLLVHFDGRRRCFHIPRLVLRRFAFVGAVWHVLLRVCGARLRHGRHAGAAFLPGAAGGLRLRQWVLCSSVLVFVLYPSVLVMLGFVVFALPVLLFFRCCSLASTPPCCTSARCLRWARQVLGQLFFRWRLSASIGSAKQLS